MRELLLSSFPGDQDPGACLVVARHGIVEFYECRGVADMSTGRPIDCDTTFRLASITKQFTATTILLLRSRGLVQLEKSVRDYLPELNIGWADNVTLTHLLHHTSGILDYEDHMPANLKEPLSDEDVLQITAGHIRTYFTAGTQFRYSNTGYALLACIASRVSGTAFPLLLEELIFRPLEMKNTVARHATLRPDVPNRALGYRRMPDGSFLFADQNLTSSVIGDGGIYCSACDYMKWDRAYWSGQVVPTAEVEAMTRPGQLLKRGTATETDRIWFPPDMVEAALRLGEGGSVPGEEACMMAGGEQQAAMCEIPYGLGWRLERNDSGLRIAYHPGSSTGFMHCVRHVLEMDLTILVLANRTVAPSKELAREVEAALLSQES